MLPGADPSLADWTPRPALGHHEPWERMTDKDWIDTRFREMNTGPALDCTLRYPLGKGQQTVYKATAVRLGAKGDAGAVFDRNTLRLSATWSGGYLNHSDRRFGLINTPTPKGEAQFAAPAGPGWADPDGKWDARAARHTAPLPASWAKYQGLYLNGDRTVFAYSVGKRQVLESAQQVTIPGYTFVESALEVGPGTASAARYLCELVGGNSTTFDVKGLSVITSGTGARVRIAWVRHTGGVELNVGGAAGFTVAAADRPTRCAVGVAEIAAKDADKVIKELAALPAAPDLRALTKAGPKRWGEPVVTKLERGKENGAFAVDTLTIPYKNRFNALFFCTGLDFLPDGRVAVCTCHGDVWLVTVDEKAATCSWQRYATGLYHPLGLKVIGGRVVVLERGQLTELFDLNDDGEADFYKCHNNDWHCGGGEHSYDTCLETDPQGNFYFFKTGDTDTPTGGCLMKVSKDGTKSEVYATGFRHPIGMGMSPTGVLTGADQEGNWMPATRIDEYKKGGFYGDMRAHHRAVAPTAFDPPLCWLPREIDNSAGGQVWVPEDALSWRALAGKPIHLSYGRCKAFILLRQELGNGLLQGGVAPLGIEFLSGSCRGRFIRDHLYVCGLNGWQTAAKADGSLQRVRPTGAKLTVPVAMEVKRNVIRLTFDRVLDHETTKPANFRTAQWNYRWGGEYGSKRWKVSDPKAEGFDEVPVKAVQLSAVGNTLELTFDPLKPAMQVMVGYNLKDADGKPVIGSVYLTIHPAGK